jgi:hypothetical protein
MTNLTTARFAAAVFALASASSVIAQTLEKAYVLAEPLQYAKQGQFRGCGVNLKLLQESQAASRDYATVSVNFWIDSPGVALVKTALSKATIGPAPATKPQPIVSSWVRIKGTDPLLPQKSMQGEDQALLTIVELSAAIDFVTVVMQGVEEVQLGFKQPGLKHERIFYGVPSVEQESRKLLEACFGELVERLNKNPRK